jgi:membrane fusion protein, adhesin transport system
VSDLNFKRLSREMAGRSGSGSSMILLIVLLLIIASVAWANYAEIDNVTRGEGRVVSSVQNQVVQASEGGVILRRYVSENTHVEAGDLLFEIDPIDASSELNQMKRRMSSLDIKEMRLRAEIKSASSFFVNNELVASSPSVALSEESLFAARRLELSGKILILEQQQAQKMQDISSNQSKFQSAERTMGLLSEEISFVEPLVRDNIAPATRLLALQRELEEGRAARDGALARITQSKLGIQELDSEIQNVKSNYTLAAMEDLNRVVADRSELEEALPRLQDRVSRTSIKAPMDGVINTIKFRTPGGFVRTGDVVLELVPTGEDLMIEAKILPKDISRILIDDQVRIRLSAYDSSKYGHVMGRVTRISPDAVVESSGSNATHFLIDVGIEGELLINDQPVDFMPGMTASVDVLSGKRTVFEYLWQPMAKIKELALRD